MSDTEENQITANAGNMGEVRLPATACSLLDEKQTPETDREEYRVTQGALTMNVVDAKFARKLERERDRMQIPECFQPWVIEELINRAHIKYRAAHRGPRGQIIAPGLEFFVVQETLNYLRENSTY